MPYRKFNPTVRELSPILNNSRKTGVWRLIDNFAGFAARSVKRERKYLDLLRPPTSNLPSRLDARACRNSKFVRADGRTAHPIVDLINGQLSNRFFPRCPLRYQSISAGQRDRVGVLPDTPVKSRLLVAECDWLDTTASFETGPI